MVKTTIIKPDLSISLIRERLTSMITAGNTENLLVLVNTWGTLETYDSYWSLTDALNEYYVDYGMGKADMSGIHAIALSIYNANVAQTLSDLQTGKVFDHYHQGLAAFNLVD